MQKKSPTVSKTSYRKFEWQGFRARLKGRPLSTNPYISIRQEFLLDDGTTVLTDPKIHRAWKTGWWMGEQLVQDAGPGKLTHEKLVLDPNQKFELVVDPTEDQ